MKKKSGFLAFILWLGGFVLLMGLHRLYVGRFWTGLLWFFTLGLFGVGQLFDLFRLGDMVRVANADVSDGWGRQSGGSANMVAPVFNVSINNSGVVPASAGLESVTVGSARLSPPASGVARRIDG